MQATLDAFSLKPFTKALTCLSKYGDDLAIYATGDTLSLSATNSSMSAYCRFKYTRPFFSKYSVGTQSDTFAHEVDEGSSITGQLLTKSLLSILKHRTIEKTVDRCELSIVEGDQPTGRDSPNDDRESLESKLIVRLHCKHGVIKTHRLLLLTPTSLMTPGIPDPHNESYLTIGPKAIKDMIEHFPLTRGPKSDPQLIWRFGDLEVAVKSLDSSPDTKGGSQLSTELNISAEEFDVYNIYSSPTTIAFHLREFNATIGFAETMTLPLELRFTDPAAPLVIDVGGENFEALFVVSTSQISGAPASQAHMPNSGLNKRGREGDSVEPSRFKKPTRVVQREEPVAAARAESNSRILSRVPDLMPPPSFPLPPPHLFSRDPRNGSMIPPPPLRLVQSFSQDQSSREPLFLPEASQLSVEAEEAIRASGLGIESMDREELEAMLEGDGEEVGYDFASQQPHESDHDTAMEDPDSFELMDETELAPTQSRGSERRPKTFKPLFED